MFGYILSYRPPHLPQQFITFIVDEKAHNLAGNPPSNSRLSEAQISLPLI
jgi:hypothetical protein